MSKTIKGQPLVEWIANKLTPEIQRLIITATDDIQDRAADSPVGKVKFTIKATINLSGKAPESDQVTEVEVVYPKKRDKSSIVQEDPDQTNFGFGEEAPKEGEGGEPAGVTPAEGGKGKRRKRGVKASA